MSGPPKDGQPRLMIAAACVACDATHPERFERCSTNEQEAADAVNELL